MPSSGHGAVAFENADGPSPALTSVLRASAVGIIGGAVLFGHVPATRPHLYAILVICIALYAIARGGAFIRAIVSYATSDVLLLRWGFVLWALASLFWIGRGGESVLRAVTLIEIHAVGVIIFDASRNLRGARWILGAAFAAAAIGALFSLATGSPVATGRLEGAYGNPNTLAVTSLVGLAVFHSGVGLGRRLWARVVSHALALALTAGVVASSSLKGVLGLVLIWTLGLTSSGGRRRVPIQIALSAGVLGVLVSSSEVFKGYWEHTVYRVAAALATTSTSASFGQSLAKRTRFIGKGVDLIGRSPVIGHGLDSFKWMSGEHTYAHNNYIDVGVALGLVGLALFYGFYARLFFGALRARNRRLPVGRFLLIMIPLMTLLEIGAVTYVMKTVSFVLLAGAGWLEMRRAADQDAPGLSSLDHGTMGVRR